MASGLNFKLLTREKRAFAAAHALPSQSALDWPRQDALTAACSPSTDTDAATGVGWGSGNSLYSVGDDKVVNQWDVNGEFKRRVCELGSYPVAISFAPAGTIGDNLAVGCSNGTFVLLSGDGRVQKSVAKAHTGAILACRFSHDGTSLVTGGEDGFVKKWSKTGNLQSKLVQSTRAVHSVAWSPDGKAVLYCSHKYLTIKPLSPQAREAKWRAGDGLVLTCDWNPINNLIVSGGEDCTYRVWDSFGRQVFRSSPVDFSVTSIAWAPSGDSFAVGSFNRLLLCSRQGWTQSSDSVSTGSIYGMAWTADGTQLACAGASGAVCFAQRVGKVARWGSLRAEIKDLRQVLVTDLMAESKAPGMSGADSKEASADDEPLNDVAGRRGEDLEFSDRIVDVSLGQSHLIVVTQAACYVYNVRNFNMQHKIEVQGSVQLLLQARSVFLLVSRVKGMRVFSMEGQLKSSPRVPGLSLQFLDRGNVALADDVLAIIDRSDPKRVHLIDTETGKPIGEPIRHPIDISEIALSNSASATAKRKLMIIDANQDLYVTRLHRPDPIKLATMVQSARWHATVPVLAAISNQQLIVWYYPHVVYVDKDLVSKTRTVRDAADLGKDCAIIDFYGARCNIQKADGTQQIVPASPFPMTLIQYAIKNKWAQCTRLCRFAKEPVLWACLAAMAIDRKQLETAAISFAAIDEVDKLECMQSIMAIPSPEGQRAELLLYQRRPKAAEQVLVHGKLIYRAIELNIRLFNWRRALKIAVKFHGKTKISHVDTVLAHRQKYLFTFNRKETDPKFVEYGKKVKVDWAVVKQKQAQELAAEIKRSGRGERDKSAILRVIIETMNAGKNGSTTNLDESQGGGEDEAVGATAAATTTTMADEEKIKAAVAAATGSAFDDDDDLAM